MRYRYYVFHSQGQNLTQNRWSDVTYSQIGCMVRPEKAEKNRTHMTAGGDRINYPFDCGTPTVDMLLSKLHFNSYLNTPLKRFEYLRTMKLNNFPEDVIEQYKLRKKVSKDKYVHVEVRRGMYMLPQAGLFVRELLEERLTRHGYYQSATTTGY